MLTHGIRPHPPAVPVLGFGPNPLAPYPAARRFSSLITEPKTSARQLTFLVRCREIALACMVPKVMATGWFGLGLRGVVTCVCGLCFGGCSGWPQNPRSPACSDAINKCMEQCANQPAAVSPKNAAYTDHLSTTNGPCEAGCQSRC
jgi:hypothetical protein